MDVCVFYFDLLFHQRDNALFQDVVLSVDHSRIGIVAGIARQRIFFLWCGNAIEVTLGDLGRGDKVL